MHEIKDESWEMLCQTELNYLNLSDCTGDVVTEREILSSLNQNFITSIR